MKIEEEIKRDADGIGKRITNFSSAIDRNLVIVRGTISVLTAVAMVFAFRASPLYKRYTRNNLPKSNRSLYGQFFLNKDKPNSFDFFHIPLYHRVLMSLPISYRKPIIGKHILFTLAISSETFPVSLWGVKPITKDAERFNNFCCEKIDLQYGYLRPMIDTQSMITINWKNLNAETLKTGLATVDTEFVNVRNDIHLKKLAELMKAQKYAEKNRVGYWGKLEKEHIAGLSDLVKENFQSIVELPVWRSLKNSFSVAKRKFPWY